MYIITDKSELSSEIKQGNIHIIDGATRFSLNDGIDCKYCPSGMILLCVCKLGAPEKITGVQWGHAQQKILKCVKDSTITATNKHHGSHGDYFSFVNKAIYGKVGTSSVSQYVDKHKKY